MAVLLCAALLGACGRSTPATAPAPPATPSGTGWPTGHGFTSTGVTDAGQARPLVAGTHVTVRFRDPGEVSVEAGCNELTVFGRLDGDRIVPKGFGATARGCAPELLAQDSFLQHFFADGPTWRLTGTELTLTAGTVEMRLRDDADRPLLATRWVVVSRTSAGTTTSVPAGVAYLIFGKNGLVGVTGCSGLAATIQVSPAAITVEPVHRSDQPCDGAVAEVDAAVMATLQGSVQYRIKGADLTLTGPDGHGLALKSQDVLDPVAANGEPVPADGGPPMMGGLAG